MLEKQPAFKNSKVQKIVPEFCVDTSVLVELYAYYMNDMNRINILTNRETYSNYHIKFIKLLRAKKIKLYVPSEALIEFYSPKKFKDLQSKKRFLEDLGFKRISSKYLPKEEKKQFFNAKQKLIKLYTNPITTEDKEKILTSKTFKIQNPDYLQHPVFNENSKMDAKIMAESVIMGVPLITLNTKHFIKNNHPEIIAYLSTKVKGISKTRNIKPIVPSDVFNMLKEGNYPAVYHNIRQEMSMPCYPLTSFAFCKKRKLDNTVIKLNKHQTQVQLTENL